MFQEAANWKIVPKNNGFIVKSLGTSHPNLLARVRVELETRVKRRFMKVSIVSYSHLSLMIIASWTHDPISLLLTVGSMFIYHSVLIVS